MVPSFTPKNEQAIIPNPPARSIFGKAAEPVTQDRIRGVIREVAQAATLRAGAVAEAVFEARQ